MVTGTEEVKRLSDVVTLRLITPLPIGRREDRTDNSPVVLSMPTKPGGDSPTIS